MCLGNRLVMSFRRNRKRKVNDLRYGRAPAIMCSFIQPKAAHAILEAILAILVVLLAADDVGKMLMPDGEENIGFDAVSVGI